MKGAVTKFPRVEGSKPVGGVQPAIWIRRLQAVGIRCVCVCSERKVFEERLDDGTIRKTSVFEFRQF